MRPARIDSRHATRDRGPAAGPPGRFRRPARALASAIVLAAAACGIVGAAPEESARGDRVAADEATPPAPLDVPSEPPAHFLTYAGLIEQGERLLDRAEKPAVKRAEEIFRMALDIDPNGPAALAGLARVTAARYARRWQEDDALVDLAAEQARRAVEAGPADPRAHAALAAAAILAEDWNALPDIADRAWSLPGAAEIPWVAEIHAQSLSARGEPERALAAMEEARAKRPGRFQTHFVIGSVLLHLGRAQEAVQAFRAVYLLEPDYSPGLVQLATAYDRLETRGPASSIFSEVVRRFPEEKGRVYTRMAVSLISRGKYREALQGLEGVGFGTKRGLGEGTVLYLRAICLEELGRTSEARVLYEQVIRDYPLASYGTALGDNLAVASVESLARLDLREGRQEDAVRRMEEALSLPRPTVTLFAKLGAIYTDYGLAAEAARVLEKGAAIDFGPRQAGAKVAIYVAWARAIRASRPADLRAAAAPVLAAIRKNASSIESRPEPTYLLEAARACLLAGDSAEAIEWLRRAVGRGYRHLDWIAVDDEMKPLAADPGFRALQASLAAAPG